MGYAAKAKLDFPWSGPEQNRRGRNDIDLEVGGQVLT